MTKKIINSFTSYLIAFLLLPSVIFLTPQHQGNLIMSSSIVLYTKSTCPYCHKVLKAMEKEGIHITVKDLNEHPEYRSQLISIGGKGQVPCLIFDGKTAMYESDDIIDYLAKHKEELR